MSIRQWSKKFALIFGGVGLAVPFVLPLVGMGGDQAPLLVVLTVPAGLVLGAVIGLVIGFFFQPRASK